MSRFDKYDPISGGSRHTLAFDVVTADVDDVIAVGLNTSGRLVRGAGATGVIGVICPTQVAVTGTRIDVMRSGEIVDFHTADGSNATAGTSYLAATADGVVSITAGGIPIGYTAEVDRLIVHVGR